MHVKRLSIFLALLLTCLGITAQKYISLKDGSFLRTVDSKDFTRDVMTMDDGVKVIYEFGYVSATEDPIYPNLTMFQMRGFGLNSKTGEPSFPRRVDSFVIPEGATIELSVPESEYIDLPIEISPARPPLFDNNYESYTKENVPQIKPFTGFFPSKIVEYIESQKYRGVQIGRVCVQPIQYNYEKKAVRIFSRLAYQVHFRGGERIINMEKIAPDDYYLSNSTLNFEQYKQSARKARAINNNGIEVTKDYLVITVPEFSSAVERFAEWKRTMGYNVIVSTQNSWNSDQIKAEAQAKYISCDNLYYLLLIGGHSKVNTDIRDYSSPYDYATDHFYGCFDGEYDTEQEIHVGRLPVMTLDEANTVIDKIIDYEKNPITDINFYKRGLNCAYFQDTSHDGAEDRRFSYTCERIKNYLENAGKTVKRVYYTESVNSPVSWGDQYVYSNTFPDSLKKTNFAWDGDGDDIVNHINNGTFYVLHRDHGEITGWVSPSFSLQHIAQLSNGSKLPVIFSMNCETGIFYVNSTRCFADSILKKKNGGAVAVFAATSTTPSYANDALAEGFFEAIWPDPGLMDTFGSSVTPQNDYIPVYQLGDILWVGKAKMMEITELFNDRYIADEAYQCFGDPSMEIRTEVPNSFTNVNVSRSGNLISVSLGSDSGRISFYDPFTCVVKSYEGNYAQFTGNINSVIVCVYAHNRIPYINNPSIYYIQNETLVGNNSITADVIKIGSNVTNTQPQGGVTFASGVFNLNANSVEIYGETTISSGVTMNINN